MKNFASYTKTGRGIAIGEAIGKSICRGGGGGSTKPEYNVSITKSKIEILDGLYKDINGEWNKEDLVLLVPLIDSSNIYKGTPEIWVKKSRLDDCYFCKSIQNAIKYALPDHLQGNVFIYNKNQILITINYTEIIITFFILIFFILYFYYTFAQLKRSL